MKIKQQPINFNKSKMRSKTNRMSKYAVIDKYLPTALHRKVNIQLRKNGNHMYNRYTINDMFYISENSTFHIYPKYNSMEVKCKRNNIKNSRDHAKRFKSFKLSLLYNYAISDPETNIFMDAREKYFCYLEDYYI